MKPITVNCALLTFFICANHCLADNWGSWRGPTGNGISTETNVPTQWSKDKNGAWRVELPGPAGATPVVWGDKIFLSTVDGENLLLMCFGTDGKEQWRREIGKGLPETICPKLILLAALTADAGSEVLLIVRMLDEEELSIVILCDATDDFLKRVQCLFLEDGCLKPMDAPSLL